jgi:stearoyl-CoA desaturase (delta-9 desaturase)
MKPAIRSAEPTLTSRGVYDRTLAKTDSGEPSSHDGEGAGSTQVATAEKSRAEFASQVATKPKQIISVAQTDVADAATIVENAASFQLHSVPLPEGCRDHRPIWIYIIGMGGLHLLMPLVFVPWLFSWTGLASVFIGNYLFCSLGIGAGYHRLLTHRGFKCSKRFEHFLAMLGACCLQDSPARWVMIHRLHHNHSDEQPDPHTPMVSWFWSHVGWLLIENRQLSQASTYEKHVRDLLEDPFYLRLERKGGTYWAYAIHAVLFWVTFFFIGWAIDRDVISGVQFGTSMLFWGVVVRTIYTWHISMAINSFSHVWGYRNYETGDNSRNNWLFALATNGEGWHNNHHADPRSARHGHRWWEIDVTYLTLRLLERLGVVWDLVGPQHSKLNRRIIVTEKRY